MTWEPEARTALKTVPRFVRGLVKCKVEQRVRAEGGQSVGLADFRAAEARFKALTKGHDSDELKRLIPAENRPGAELTVITACHNRLSNCPNALIDTDRLAQQVTDRLAAGDVSERLRAGVDGDQVLFHHKLKVAIAGCPNGCSRPQIADVGLIGMVEPRLDSQACTGCGSCVLACPDRAIDLIDDRPVFDLAACQGCLTCQTACPAEAISLTEPKLRLTMGGKLGRHPHLADQVADGLSFDRAVELAAAEINDFLTGRRAGQRLADFRLARQNDSQEGRS